MPTSDIKSKYNFLTPIKKVEYNKKKRMWDWLFRCDCGVEKIINIGEVRKNRTKSCGCLKNKNLNHNKSELSINWKSKTPIPITYINSVKRRAISKKIEFNINEEYIYKIFSNQNGKCNLSGLDLSIDLSNFTASIDRIDSKSGYVEGNIQWLHKDLNYIKYNLNQKELYFICEKIKNKHGI